MTDHEKKIVKLVREAATAICESIRSVPLSKAEHLARMRCCYKGLRCFLTVERQEHVCFVISTIEWENGSKHYTVFDYGLEQSLLVTPRHHIHEDLEDFLFAGCVEHEFESLLTIAKNSQRPD